MKIINYKGDEQKWLADREGKITGTGLGKVLSQTSDKPKVGFYDLIAKRINKKGQRLKQLKQKVNQPIVKQQIVKQQREKRLK